MLAFMKARLTVYCWWNHLLEWHFSFYIVWLAESVTDIHGGLFTVRSVKILFAPQKSPPLWLCPYCLKALRLLSLGIGHGYPMTNFQKKKRWLMYSHMVLGPSAKVSVKTNRGWSNGNVLLWFWVPPLIYM